MKIILMSASPLDGLVYFLVALAICIGLFLALRAMILWYWKIDAIVTNQEKQIKLLSEMSASLNKMQER